MRIWDLPPSKLCDVHLIAEHHELHAVWTILTEGRKGYSKHPETMRWKGKLAALYTRHKRLVSEFEHRGFKHRSPLERRLAVGLSRQAERLDSIERQIDILRSKGCDCRL